MTRCPDCRRRFTRAGHAAYKRQKEAEAALRAEVDGEAYDVPARFRTPPASATVFPMPSRHERHQSRSEQFRARGELA